MFIYYTQCHMYSACIIFQYTYMYTYMCTYMCCTVYIRRVCGHCLLKALSLVSPLPLLQWAPPPDPVPPPPLFAEHCCLPLLLLQFAGFRLIPLLRYHSHCHSHPPLPCLRDSSWRAPAPRWSEGHWRWCLNQLD